MYPHAPYSRLHAMPQRQAFQKSHTALGAAGHWVHVAAALAPMAVSELVEDAAKRRKWMGAISVGTAIVYQGLWTMRENNRREERAAAPAR